MILTYRNFVRNYVKRTGVDCVAINKITRNYTCSNEFTYKVTKDDVLTYLCEGGASSEIDYDFSAFERVGLYLQNPDVNCIDDTVVQGHALNTLSTTYSIQAGIVCMGFNKTTKLVQNISLPSTFNSYCSSDSITGDVSVYESNKHSILQFFIATPAVSNSFIGSLNFSAETNIHIFPTKEELLDYLYYGEKESKTYILSSNSYRSASPLASNAEFLNHTKTQLTVPKDSTGRICGYVLDFTNNSNFDILLKWDSIIAQESTDILQQFNATAYNYSNIANISNPYHKYSNVRYMGNAYILGKILPETNIPIYASEGEADDYIGGGNPTPIYDGGGGGSEDNDTGEEDKETALNEISENQPVLSAVYVCDKSAMNSFAETLYSTSIDVVDAITEGLKRYGENPINFVVDCFYVPFNVSSFITEMSVSQLPFGSYNATISGDIKKVTHNNTLLTIADFNFKSAYNDYRDYEYNYYLYLPYIGISVIEVENYINKNIKIKAFFDIRTGNIKYYIFANNNLMKTFEGNIRVAMPLTGSDKAAQASQYISGLESIAGGTATMVEGVAQSKGIVGGIISGATTIIQGSIDLYKGAPKTISGNSSPSTAIKDALYPYLIIERPTYSTNANEVRSQYNKPDYNYRTVSQCNGFVKFSDFNLISNCNQAERDEILMILSDGIYV